MPYLTPDTAPGTTKCRVLIIPDEKNWLALVTGALSELTHAYNFEKFGTATPEETAQAFRDMLALYEDCQPAVSQLAIVEHRETSGTSGGTFLSGAWRQRTLNTIVYNPDSWISLSSNQITVPAGTYRIRASAENWHTNQDQLALFNMTAGGTILAGSVSERHENASVYSHSRTAELEWIGVFSVTTAIALYHVCLTSSGTYGFGVAFGALGYEVFARVVIEKLPE